MTKAVGLIFLGPPGSGKGTQSVQLAESLHIPHVSTGAILRFAIEQGTPLGHKAKAYVTKGELVPDDLILDLVQERFQQQDIKTGWILDGFPRNVDQAVFLDGLLASLDQPPGRVVNLEVPDQVLIARLLQRGRQDDNEDTIRRRLEVYQEQTAPLIAYYQEKGNLSSVNGDRSPGEVTQTLTSLLVP